MLTSYNHRAPNHRTPYQSTKYINISTYKQILEEEKKKKKRIFTITLSKERKNNLKYKRANYTIVKGRYYQ
jgi:hypothetical protein